MELVVIDESAMINSRMDKEAVSGSNFFDMVKDLLK